VLREWVTVGVQVKDVVAGLSVLGYGCRVPALGVRQVFGGLSVCRYWDRLYIAGLSRTGV